MKKYRTGITLTIDTPDRRIYKLRVSLRYSKDWQNVDILIGEDVVIQKRENKVTRWHLGIEMIDNELANLANYVMAPDVQTFIELAESW